MKINRTKKNSIYFHSSFYIIGKMKLIEKRTRKKKKKKKKEHEKQLVK